MAFSVKFSAVALVCLIASVGVLSAPTETTTTTPAPAPEAPATTTTTAPTTTAASPSAATAAAVDQASPAPSTDDLSKGTNTTASMAVSSASDPVINTTSFTCYSRSIGYYADVEHGCKVYHFCLLGEYNGEQVYQRISYLCLNDSLFDQQALDCVAPAKMTAPCKDSPSYYEQSNAILRQAIIGSQMGQGQNQTAADHTEAPATITASN